MDNDFLSVTELANNEVSQEQVDRLCTRYYWAGGYCVDKDLLEAACGTGQGLGYLASKARSLKAGDISEQMLERARAHYGNRIKLLKFDAQATPFETNSLDVIILFEAIYYIPSANKFIEECKRILRPGGKILLSSANPDLYDFNPSPYSHEYFGITDLHDLFAQHGFSTEFYVDTPLEEVSLRQKILRPIKKIAVSMGLMPKTMAGKTLLKRLVFGGLVLMPAEINDQSADYVAPKLVTVIETNVTHKVIYCAATLDH